MRGIAGYVGLGGDELAETVLHRMGRQVGSAGRQVAVHGGVGLVGPTRSPDGRYLLAYEGELYNERELIDELAPTGAGGGPALVLAAWARWGEAALDRFNGRFALAIFDTTAGEVTLARDPVGWAPLYFAADGSGRVAFGSEIRAVLAAGVVPRRPDDLTVYRYLTLGVHDDTERTFFDRVTRLLPGELVVISTGGQLRRETYTGLFRELDRLAAGRRPATRSARAHAREAVAAAIERRMASEEAAVGASLADPLDLDRLADDLPDLVGCQQEPVGSIAAYADYCLTREVSRQTSVLVDRSAASEFVIGHLRQAGQPPLRLRFRRRGGATAPATRLLAPDFVATYRQSPAAPAAAGGDPPAGELFQRRVPALLRCQDRNCARFRVRRREPYLDPYLLRVLWSLDPAAVRSVTGKLLPPTAIRPSQPWPAPLPPLARRLFRSERFGARPYVDAKAVLGAYRAGELDPALGWRLINLELWLRGLVDRDPTLPPAATFVDHYPRPERYPKPERAAAPAAEPPARSGDDDLVTVDAGS